MIKKFFKLKQIFYLIVLTGIFLATFQYFYNRSLWLDEAMLSLNIINKNFFELTQPLDRNQVAPIGFLFLEKIMINFFGENEFSLRFLPFLSFILTIPLFYLFTKKITTTKIIAMVSTAFFCLTPSILYYSSEVKQYSIDVLIGVALAYFTISFDFRKNLAIIIYSIVGFVSIWVSNISVLVLFTCGIYLLYIEVYKKKSYLIIISLLITFFTFIFYYYLFIHSHSSRQGMEDYWNHGFLPLNPISPEFFHFFIFSFKEVYSGLLSYGRFWLLAFFISLIGLVFLLKNGKYFQIFFLIVPLCLHLLISGLKLYPFSGRLILYLVPNAIILFVTGLYFIFKIFERRLFLRHKPMMFLPAVYLFFTIFSFYGFPIEKEELKKSLYFISNNAKPNDFVYVSWSVIPAFQYYKELEIFSFLNSQRIIYGDKFKSDMTKHDLEISELTGAVWFLFSNISEKEEIYIKKFILKNKGEILNYQQNQGSNLYLFKIPTIELNSISK